MENQIHQKRHLKKSNFEKSIIENYGIIIQVGNPDDSILVSNDMTLSESGK